MLKTVALKIENDEFKPSEIHLNLGDVLEVIIDGFIPPDQKYTLVCKEFSKAEVSPYKKFIHKFIKTGNFIIKCEEKLWMYTNIFVKNPIEENPGIENINCQEPPSIIKISGNTSNNQGKNNAQIQNFINRNVQKTSICEKNIGKDSVDCKTSDKNKLREKKNEHKFKKKLKNKETIEELIIIISHLIDYATKHKNDNSLVNYIKITTYLSQKFTFSKISLPQKYKDSLLKFILSSPDPEFISKNKVSYVISSIFSININFDQPKQYISNLSAEKIEKLLENRIFIYRMD